MKAKYAINSHLYFPLKFTVLAFMFLYLLQYPLLHWAYPNLDKLEYSTEAWILAYAFILMSVLIFLLAMIIGLAENHRASVSQPLDYGLTVCRPPLRFVIFTFIVFFAWSYLMVELRIGMTINFAVEPLPFKLVGILVYGRLLIQPIILLWISYSYKKSVLRVFILILLISLGFYASLSSGSRFVGILFSLPILLLYTNWVTRWFFWVSCLFLFLGVATLSRSFYLPEIIGGDVIEIYGNSDFKESLLKNIWFLPIEYVLFRSMGIGEVLMTLSFGLVTPSMTDSVLRLFSAFIPFLDLGSSVSIKDVYGVPETTFGGFGLDFFSNYWVRFGGTLTTYVTGLFMCGFLLGKVYVLVSSIARKLGVDEKLIPFPFVFLFLLMYDGRIQLFAGLLLISWVLGKRCSIKILRSLIRAVPGVRSRVGGL